MGANMIISKNDLIIAKMMNFLTPLKIDFRAKFKNDFVEDTLLFVALF